MEFQRKILIVEDDQFIGSLLAGALAHEGFVTQHASSALAAKRQVEKFDPDAILVDIDLGSGPSGIDLIKVISITRPDIATILLSKHADLESAGLIKANIPAGVSYLRKSLMHDTTALVSAINEVMAGAGKNVRQDRHEKGKLDLISKTQREILHSMALGLSNKEIAKQRGVTVSNVEQRVTGIYKAFNIVANDSVVPRVEAIRVYFSEGGVPRR